MKQLLFFLLLSTFSLGQGLFIANSNTHVVNSGYLILSDIDLTINGTLTTNGTVKFTNGNFTMNGNFNSGTSQFSFTNTTTHDHYISASTSSNNTFYDLLVQGDISTQYDLHLLSDINITNHLQIQSQKFNLNNHGIDLGTTGHLYYEGNGQYLYDSDPSIGNGYIQSTATIPANTVINPGNLGLEITTHSNQMGVTTIRRYHRMADIGDNVYGLHRIFDVTPTYNGTNYGGNLNVDLKFQYFDDMLGPIGDVLSLKLYRSGDGGVTWENKGGIVDIDNGYITVTGFNQFSQVTLAPDNSALPVEMLYFDVTQKYDINLLEWATASEHNSAYFEIEHSDDGLTWTSINKTPAAGNSQCKINYNYYHAAPKFINYYRIKQFDINGYFKLYGPIIIDNTVDSKQIKSYTNLLGQTLQSDATGIIIVIYKDGTIKKIIR